MIRRAVRIPLHVLEWAYWVAFKRTWRSGPIDGGL